MKYTKYILILLITLFIGCNKTYAAAEYEKNCYYMSSNEDFKATLTIKSGFDSRLFHIERGYAVVYIEQVGEKIGHKRVKVENWYGTDKLIGSYYKNEKEANNDKNPSCPKYLVTMTCNDKMIDYVYATENPTIAQNVSQYIGGLKVGAGQSSDCKGYSASSTTAEQYYGSFADLTPGGTPTDVTCDTLFGDKNDENSIAYMINNVLGYVRIIVPILIILFGTLDLAKCVMAGREDEIRKAQSTFIRRLIAGVAVFFVPMLVNIIMDLADIVWEGLGYSSCNL